MPALLSRQTPVSWLFLGDSFTPKGATEPRPWRLYTSRVAGIIETDFQRSKDRFIDATFPLARLSEVGREFQNRMNKFQPDICFLSLTLADANLKSMERFERMLVQLIQWSRKFRCQLVLQTPPCLPAGSDASLTRRLILVESIRGIAAEHDVPLIDHWEHWELAAEQTSHSTQWLDAESQTPGEQGHRQLSVRFVTDLKLAEISRNLARKPREESISAES